MDTPHPHSPSAHTPPLTSIAQSPSSLIIPISRTDIFPLPSPRVTLKTADIDGATMSIADDESALTEQQQQSLSFPLLPGEGMVDSCALLDGGRLILTNYRLYVQLGEDEEYHVPLGLIESVDVKELFYLGVGCKDARSYRCTFDNNEQCLQWFGTLLKASEPPRQLQELFAFSYYAWSRENTIDDFTVRLEDCRTPVYDDAAFMKEVQRLQFGSVWRISSANEEYKMCSSYPPKLLVPSNIQDDKLEAVAKFRSSRRIPAVVWRHIGNGAVIARCSQPEVGWLGWRSSDDEDLLKEILHACAMDAMPATALDTYSHSPALSSDEEAAGAVFTYGGGGVAENGEREEGRDKVDEMGRLLNGGELLKVNTEKKVLIMDARSYTTAVANRARGGGCECPEYYPSCEIQFMNLANIHSIRKSFHALRQLCTSAADQPNWFSLLEGTRWLLHQSGLMRAAVTLVTAIERDARPVLVHCSDGWDRTPQIVALAQLLLDPYYRTIDGFRILIEREWLAFGHKFADRCGHTTGSEDQNERCPVFLQWLDCVHQLLQQFPCSFEFSDIYLVKLVQHTYSNLFGTFLCNTKKDRDKELFNTFPVWTFLDTALFRNYLYKPAPSGVQALWPKCNVRDLKLWSAVYLGSLETTKHDNTTAHPPHQQTTDTPAPTTTPTLHQDTTTTTTIITNHKPPATTTTTKRTTPSPTHPTPLSAHIPLAHKQQHAGNLMTKTRSYGDLLSARTLIACSQQCACAANNGLQARVGVGGGGGAGVCVTDGGHVGATDARRMSDPSAVDIKILNLAMVEHTYTDTPHNPAAHERATGSVAASRRNVRNASIERSAVMHGQRITVASVAACCVGDTVAARGDINHNDGCADRAALPSARQHVRSLKDSCERLLNGNSVDASTETLVAAENCTGARVSALNATPPLSPRINYDDVDSGRSATTICSNSDNQSQPPPIAKLTCAVCAQNKRFVNETHFNHHQAANEESTISDHNSYAAAARSMAANGAAVHMTAAPPVHHLPAGNGHQCCNASEPPTNYIANGYYGGSGSSNVTSGVNTPTSHVTDDSVTAALAGANAMGSGAMSMSPGYWGGGGTVAPSAAGSLGDDGLVPLRSEMQDRVATLIDENRREVERLKQELQKYRYALLQQLCHRCQHRSGDKNDDAAYRANTSPTHPHNTTDCHCPPTTNTSGNSAARANPSSAANGFNYTDDEEGAAGAVGEGGAGGEYIGRAASSMRSDHSWDNVDDVSLHDHQSALCMGRGGANPTLWMPDHAVSRCADCRCEFWIGRRRHHCRKCGQIFCAECSEHYAPIPAEHLYAPVRVCRGCFTALRNANIDLRTDEHEHIEISDAGDGNIAAAPNGGALDEFTGGYATTRTIHPHFNSITTAQHKPPPLPSPPPPPPHVQLSMQCCHHQHHQQQLVGASSTSSSSPLSISASPTSSGGGGGCGGGANGGQCRQITASSN